MTGPDVPELVFSFGSDPAFALGLELLVVAVAAGLALEFAPVATLGLLPVLELLVLAAAALSEPAFALESPLAFELVFEALEVAGADVSAVVLVLGFEAPGVTGADVFAVVLGLLFELLAVTDADVPELFGLLVALELFPELELAFWSADVVVLELTLKKLASSYNGISGSISQIQPMICIPVAVNTLFTKLLLEILNDPSP